MKKPEPMPEFENGDEAYEWMQRRLNKSWADDISSLLSPEDEAALKETHKNPKAGTSSKNTAGATNATPSAGTHNAPPAVDISMDFEGITEEAFKKMMGFDDIGQFDDPSS